MGDENKGEKVVSWQARHIWDGFKKQVKTEKDALDLTAMMRVAEHHYLKMLDELMKIGCVGYLESLLHLEYALNKYELVGFNEVDFGFEKLLSSSRHETYAEMKIERVKRIALKSLDEYVAKANRRIIPVLDDELTRLESEVLAKARTVKKSDDYDTLTAKQDQYNNAVARLLMQRGVPRGYDSLFSRDNHTKRIRV